MSSIEARLLKCFHSVFPLLSPEELRSAAHDTVGNWDSQANITLFMVIQEEFGLTIDFEELETFESFARILNYLEKATAGAK